MKKRKYYLVILVIVSFLCSMGSRVFAYADIEKSGDQKNNVHILQQYTTEAEIHLFVTGVSQVDDITCQIGNTTCHEVGWHTLQEAEEERRTLVLIDNSISVGRKHQKRIETVVLDLFANASENEKFMVATFGEETEILSEYTNLYAPLEEAVMGIKYRNRDTFLTDAVYEEIIKWNKETEPVYKRIILISDGQEQESWKYTREELYTILSQNTYPIYTIGCVTGGNISATSHMSALSRITGAREYRVTSDGDLEGIVSNMLSEREVLHIRIIPDVAIADGRITNMKMTIASKGKTTDLLAEIRLPVIITKSSEIVSENAPNSEKITQNEDTPKQMINKSQSEVAPLNAVNNDESENDTPLLWLLCAMSIILIILFIIYALLLFLKKKNQKEVDIKPHQSQVATLKYDRGLNTVLLRNDSEPDEGTRLLFEEYDIYEITLTDQNNPTKYYSLPIKDSIIIGRSSKNNNVIIDYDESISGRHCEIENRNGRFFVKDLCSSNGTRVNGIRVLSETEIFHGNILRIGQIEMRVGWNLHE